jgi:hypothetical protein
MKRSWDLKPNLRDCILEERIVPAFNNFGIVILTTSGLSLVTPFPGASNNASGSGGSSNTAASVSGAAQPTSLYVTGNRGVSSLAPGNFTGNPSVGGGAAIGTSGGVSVTIQVGSGADQAGGPVSTTQASSRTNPADNGNRAPVMAYIGSVASGSSSSSTAPAGGQATQTAPVPQLPPQGVVLPGSPTGPGAGGSTPTNPMNPQLGAPRLVRGLGGSLMPSLPGGLGVGTSPTAPGPGY